ncbi:MAG: ShlB/FhaC/HecB family hemolysin secretion/activation protein, partial [Bradyrhizobium sp.]
MVQVTEKRTSANGHIDNRGTAARGPFEYYGAVTLNNIAGWHEAVTFTYAGVVPLKELNYAAINYRQVLNSEGLGIFADFSDTWGTPGTALLEALQYRTLGPYIDGGLSYPFIRSREQNLTLSGLMFGSNNSSNELGLTFTNDRIRGVRVKLDGDLADQTQAVNQFNVTVSKGIDGLGSTQNGNPLASRLAGRVDFEKIELTLSRTQPLGGRFSAYLSGYGQYALTPLLVPEQCGFGGRYFGRAFDPSQLLGDSCIEGVGELRFDVPVLPGQLLQTEQVYGFGDFGRLYTREASIGTPAVQRAASVGCGIRVSVLSHVDADLTVARAIEG